jgi:6-pyruvoyltetrahydropterin/6-carboxytetrahydropterin synthase
MLQLCRTVRFAVNPPGSSLEPGPNGFAGSPPIRGLGRHYELRIICAGDADPRTGYLLDIKDIDRAARDLLIPTIQNACDRIPATEPSALLPDLYANLSATLGGVLSSLRWNLSPYYSVEMSDPDTVLLRQRFDFSASHRLHIPELSDEENRRRFGKCNNATGHGHNYQFEPCVALPAGDPTFTLDTLERLSSDALLKRFDHKNLTIDCPEFQVGPGARGLNATVENIAKVFYGILADAITRASPTARLRSITVWETDRTCATFPA